MRKAGLLVAVFLGAACSLLGDASAKTAYDSPYGFERTWNASMRLVRVDMGLKITEKDESTGYLLFDYKSSEAGNKTSSGSIELVRPAEGSAAGVHVVVQLPQLPRYHETVLLDALVRKMKQDYGEPPPPGARPRVVDAGAADAP